MGSNAVAVIYVDHCGDKNRSVERMDAAIRNTNEGRPAKDGGFGFGTIVSVAHADYDQVVIVGRNTGQRIQDAVDVSPVAILGIIDFLERNGYKVSKKKSPK